MKLSFFLLLLLALAAVSFSSAHFIGSLPGFSGPLPFKLETGYIGVGENDEIQLFYYFIESEGDPAVDPLIIWFTGGPGCSGFSALVYEMGPVTFEGSLPILKLNPYSWTKDASIIFVDSPVGTGFSYSTTSQGNITSDSKSAQDNYTFLKKWLLSHPEFIKNRLFIAGDSAGGKYATMLALKVAEGIEDGVEPKMLLQGYLIGNTVTNALWDYNERIPFAHRMGLISDEYYKLAKVNCRGQYVVPDLSNKLCYQSLELVDACTTDLRFPHILEPACISSTEESLRSFSKWPYAEAAQPVFIRLPGDDRPHCRDESYVSSAIWANNETVREALHIRKGTKDLWERCSSSLTYELDTPNVLEYYKLLNKKGYEALLYSGDHDMVIPYMATLKAVRALNFTVEEQWRPWKVDLQVAGYTERYTNEGASVTFATIKGGGHTAPEYKPKECLEMMRRFTSGQPL